MTRRKKFTSYITMLALAVMMVMSSLTVAKAGDSKTGFSLYTEAYYGKDYDVSDFAEKNTNKSVELSVDYSTGGFDYRVLGSNSSDGSSYEDCSNGYVYRIGNPSVEKMYNWVYEWGYDYAGLRVDAVNDSYTAQSGWFIPR
ncbi:MAG TPA: hypothetical protein DCR83_11065 [Eubacterium sp.]|nr:hypothetical protein [Eubacterium sp.]HCO34866.1 hypothetical protein [Eubacterium sp.]